MWDYRYGDQEQCIVSSTFCGTTDTLVADSVLLVLPIVELSLH